MCDDRLYYVEFSSMLYSVKQNIDIGLLCNALSVKNTGTSVVTFNDEPILPGQSKAINLDRGEVLTGRYAIAFTLVAPGFVAPATPINQAAVSLKYYIKAPAGVPINMP